MTTHHTLTLSLTAEQQKILQSQFLAPLRKLNPGDRHEFTHESFRQALWLTDRDDLKNLFEYLRRELQKDPGGDWVADETPITGRIAYKRQFGAQVRT